MAGFFEVKENSILLNIKLAPNARQEAFGDVVFDENEIAWLKISVRAVPENGKANKALIVLLAKHLKLAKSTIEITSGHLARTKKLSIENPTDSLIIILKEMAKYKN